MTLTALVAVLLVFCVAANAASQCNRAALQRAAQEEISLEIALAGECTLQLAIAHCSVARSRARCRLGWKQDPDVSRSTCSTELKRNLGDALVDIVSATCADERLELEVQRAVDPSSWSINILNSSTTAVVQRRCDAEWMEPMSGVAELQRDHGCALESHVNCAVAAGAARCALPHRVLLDAARVPRSAQRTCRIDEMLRSLEARVASLLAELEEQRGCAARDVRVVRVDRLVESEIARAVQRRVHRVAARGADATEVWIARVAGTSTSTDASSSSYARVAGAGHSDLLLRGTAATRQRSRSRVAASTVDDEPTHIENLLVGLLVFASLAALAALVLVRRRRRSAVQVKSSLPPLSLQ